jgi:hypothetical protein
VLLAWLSLLDVPSLALPSLRDVMAVGLKGSVRDG